MDATTTESTDDLSVLPDDAMLAVLSFLRPEELLAVRPVCHRLRDLALHPELWRRFSFDVHLLKLRQCCTSCARKTQIVWHLPLAGCKRRNLFAAAVRLAPCAASLTVSTGSNSANRADGALALLADSDCAAAKLVLIVDPRQALVVAVIIKRQAALGRLRELHLQFLGGARKASRAGLSYLLQVLDNVAGLVTLEITMPASVDEAKWLAELPRAAIEPALPMEASLEELILLNNMSSLEPRLSLYLDRHAATLRQVSVGSDAPGLAEKLAKLPELVRLVCPPLVKMFELIRVHTLRSLALVVKPKMPLVDAKLFLLYSYYTLMDVTLQYPEGQLSDQVVDLVEALGGPEEEISSRPVLRRLVLEYSDMPRKPQPPLGPLAAVLPRLTGLHILDLGGSASDEFLEAVDARVLPELRTLRVLRAVGCAHEWLHSAAMQALLRRCPRLHLEIVAPDDGHGREEDDDDEDEEQEEVDQPSNAAVEDGDNGEQPDLSSSEGEDESDDGEEDEEPSDAGEGCEFCKAHPSCHSGLITSSSVALYSHGDEDCDVCRDTRMMKTLSAVNR